MSLINFDYKLLKNNEYSIAKIIISKKNLQTSLSRQNYGFYNLNIYF